MNFLLAAPISDFLKIEWNSLLTFRVAFQLNDYHYIFGFAHFVLINETF